MIIRDRIKEHITTEITPYVESGSKLSFESENRNGTQARMANEDYDFALEWPYKFDVSITKFLGESMAISHTAFDTLVETYRKKIGVQMAGKEEITLGIGTLVILRSIKFEQIEENKNFTARFILEYSHIEEY
jgi:hypothetical protein